MSKTKKQQTGRLSRRPSPAPGSTLALSIADALMENGFRMKAKRLQLRGPNEEDLGGLCREMVVKIIKQQIAANKD